MTWGSRGQSPLKLTPFYFELIMEGLSEHVFPCFSLKEKLILITPTHESTMNVF